MLQVELQKCIILLSMKYGMSSILLKSTFCMFSESFFNVALLFVLIIACVAAMFFMYLYNSLFAHMNWRLFLSCALVKLSFRPYWKLLKLYVGTWVVFMFILDIIIKITWNYIWKTSMYSVLAFFLFSNIYFFLLIETQPSPFMYFCCHDNCSQKSQKNTFNQNLLLYIWTQIYMCA